MSFRVLRAAGVSGYTVFFLKGSFLFFLGGGLACGVWDWSGFVGFWSIWGSTMSALRSPTQKQKHAPWALSCEMGSLKALYRLYIRDVSPKAKKALT